MGYDIYIQNKDKSKVIKLPFIPSELPELEFSITNEEFKSYNNGSYNFINKEGLYSFTLEGELPMKQYGFSKSNYLATDIIQLLNNAKDNEEYIRIVIIKSDGSTYVNDMFSIESGYKYKVLKNENYYYTLPVKRYREVSKNAYALGWNRNATGWWYCYDYDNYKWYSSEWKYIDNEWYYFNESGYALSSQWFLYNNNWYYLDENCKMVHDSWKQINGKWYYLGEQGKMYSNGYTPDGYWVDETGAWKE